MTARLLGLFSVNASILRTQVARFLTRLSPLADAEARVGEAAATVGDGRETSQ